MTGHNEHQERKDRDQIRDNDPKKTIQDIECTSCAEDNTTQKKTITIYR